MGIVLKQGFWNSVWIYLGMAIGYFNLMILFPNWMTKDEFGLTRLILSFSIVVAQFAQFGGGNTILKYLYEYSNSLKLRNVLLTFGTILTTTGVLLAITFLIVGKGLVVSQYEENASLFVEYYGFIFLLVGIIAFYELFSSYSVAYLSSSVTTFLRECFFRVFQTILLILYYFELIDLQLFVALTVATYFVMAFLIYLYLVIKYKFKFNFSLRGISKRKYKSYIDYSLFILLSSSSSIIAAQIDILMIGSMSINGLSDIAVYTIGLYMSTIIHLPYRGANKIIFPLVGKAMQENRLDYVRNLYVSTSVIFASLAGFVFVGIWSNMDSILVVLGQDYSDVLWVFFFLGIGKCYDMVTGINDNIIMLSKYYRYSTYSLIILMVFTALFNYFLIPKYGIVGAAISTLMAIIINNTFKLIFIYMNFKMIPFNVKHISSAVVILGCFLVGSFFPKINNYIVDMAVRSVIIATVFLVLFIGLKVSNEFNELLKKRFNAIRGRIN